MSETLIIRIIMLFCAYIFLCIVVTIINAVINWLYSFPRIKKIVCHLNNLNYFSINDIYPLIQEIVLLIIEPFFIVKRIIEGFFLAIKNRSDKKKQKIDIIQTENLQKFEQLFNRFNLLEKYIKKAIYPLLYEISDIEKINIICQECFKNRNPLLVKLIVDKQWIASQPASVKVYTILKTNQLKLIENSDGEEVKYLLDSLKDKDPEIATRAKQSLEEIRIINQHGIDYLSQEWLLKERDKFLESIIVKHKYQALSPIRVKILTALKTGQLEVLSDLNLEQKHIVINAFYDTDKNIANNAQKMGDLLQYPLYQSFLYFITEQWQKYEQIDFDQSLLKIIFNNADSSLKKKITEKIKISGRSDWLQVIFAERKRKNIELMTNYDWQVTIELLSTTDNDREKWKLAQQAPPFYSQQLLKQIDSLDFINGKKFFEANLFNLGKKVIANPSDNIFCINENSETVTLTGHNWIYSLVMNREGTLLASCSGDKTIKLWKLPSGQLLHTLTGHTHWIYSLVMNREGTLLASASKDETIKLWELPSGRLLRTLISHTNTITSLVINREGTLLVSGSGDTTIKLWELPSGRLLHTLISHTAIWSLVMNREGTLLASGSKDKTIKLWKLYSLDRLPVSKIVNYSSYIQETLKRDDLNENQRNWYEFMLALINNYRSFEIDIEDAPIIAEAGEFDIEIEG